MPGTDRGLTGTLNTSDEEWLGVVGRVGLCIGQEDEDWRLMGAGGGVCVDRVYGRVGSQGAAELEIGGVVPFVDVKQVLIVNILV